jgi:general secretion pathway protein G
LRHQIDAYIDDKRKAPQSLEDLVRAGYLTKVPVDPMTGHADWRMSPDHVHSASDQIGTKGTPYNSW